MAHHPNQVVSFQSVRAILDPFQLSARTYRCIEKLARSIAHLAGVGNIAVRYLPDRLQYNSRTILDLILIPGFVHRSTSGKYTLLSVGAGVTVVGDGVSGVGDGVSVVGDGVKVVDVGVSVVGEGVSVVGDGVSVVGDGVSVVSGSVREISQTIPSSSSGFASG